MIPLSDENPTVRVPWMTIAILVVTFAVWIFVQGADLPGNAYRLTASVCNFGLIPAELTHRLPVGFGVPIDRHLQCVVDNDPINYFTPVLSIFLHGSWGHILGNALFFWVFGRSIEDVMGPARFLAFYLICGVAAAMAHVAVEPASAVPTVGASGAISGIMGAYLLLFPRVRIRMLFLFIIFIRVIPIPAWVVLLWWFAVQVLTGLPDIASPHPEIAGGVAVWAHVGGFLAGALLIRLFARPDLMAQRRRLRVSFTGF